MPETNPIANLVFQLDVTCSQPTPMGQRDGGTAVMIPITGGTVSGEKLNGEVVPGGADWALIKDDGTICVKAHYAIKAMDGTLIEVFNEGVNQIDRASPAAAANMLTTPRFIAPDGEHAWLNSGVFVGTLLGEQPDPDSQSMTVRICIFQMMLS
jgi:hypothetical protein